MITALYTETLAQFLERNESSSQWQALKSRFNLMPKFDIDFGEDYDHFDKTFYELFVDKYDIREIGAETDSLFYHFVNETLSEVLIKFRPKVITVVENFNKLMDRKIELARDGDNKYYLNPINTQSDKLRDKSTYEEHIERPLGFWYSNARVLNELLEIKDIYNEALDEFEKCFMGVM